MRNIERISIDEIDGLPDCVCSRVGCSRLAIGAVVIQATSEKAAAISVCGEHGGNDDVQHDIDHARKYPWARDASDLVNTTQPLLHNWYLTKPSHEYRYKSTDPDLHETAMSLKKGEVITSHHDPELNMYRCETPWVSSGSRRQLIKKHSAPLAKADKRMLHDRDGGKCGVHVGGCGRDVDITSTTDATRDEIIPRSYFQSREGRKFDNQWFAEWNTQIMHRRCNEIRGGYEVLPQFRCRCHFAHIDAVEQTLRILYEHAPNEWGSYTVCDGVIGSSFPVARMMVAPQKKKGGGKVLAAAADSAKVGIRLPLFTEYAANKQNISEMARIDPHWIKKMRGVVKRAWDEWEFKIGLDGYFRFSVDIGRGSLAPRLMFALPHLEADWLGQSGLYMHVRNEGNEIKHAWQQVDG